MIHTCDRVSCTTACATWGYTEEMLFDLSQTTHTARASTGSPLIWGSGFRVWILPTLSLWPCYLRARVVPVHCHPSFEARAVLTSSCFYLLPSQPLHQALEFLVQRLLLDIMNRGNNFLGHGLGQWVQEPAMLKWPEQKKWLAARYNDGCESSGQWMVLQLLRASPLRSGISFQCLEVGKEFRERRSACFCWPNSPAQHLSLPAKSNTINEAGERPVVIYRFKMNWAYWLFSPFSFWKHD